MQLVGSYPRDLIGQEVWYFNWKFDSCMTPRHGVINGLGSQPGHVNVTVDHDHRLDQFGRSMREMSSYPEVPLVMEAPKNRTLGEHVCILTSWMAYPDPDDLKKFAYDPTKK